MERYVRCASCGLPHEAGTAVCPFTGSAMEPVSQDVPAVTADKPDRPSPSVPPIGGALIDGRYRVKELLGRGGMGAVYAGEHVGLGRPVAIKVLLLRYERGSAAEKRFLREARAASRVDHPNVIQLYDVGTLPDGAPYLVMELLHGESLEQRLEREDRLSPYEAVAFIDQVLRGLGAAHDQGVVHRDIKPDNIFVGEHDGEVCVKLVDFSISKILGEAASITRPGDVLGTPHYLAPEQTTAGPFDHRADLWGIGAVLYEALAGAPPFDAPGFQELFEHIRYRDPVSLIELRPDVGQALEAAVMRALRKDPDERYASAAEMAEALQEALAKLAPGPEADTTPDPMPWVPDPLGDTHPVPPEEI